jgi:polyhydroxybutyrate depolymerase
MMARVGRRLGVAALALAVAALAQPGDSSADILQGTISVDGIERSYDIFVPESVAARRRPAPAIIALHGALGNSERMRSIMAFDERAERDGFIVVYPEGLNGGWNDGRGVSFRRRPSRSEPDDVKFLTRLAQSLERRGLADPERIFVMGVSNGGMMVQRLACETADVFAGFASIIANMPVNVIERCAPPGPVPMMMINATEDTLVPYDGGRLGFRRDFGEVVSTSEMVDFWYQNNGCVGRPGRRVLPDRDPDDGSRVVMFFNTDCRDDAPVILLRVEGGGHRVPGSPVLIGPGLGIFLGEQNNDISSAEVILRFFAGLDVERSAQR